MFCADCARVKEKRVFDVLPTNCKDQKVQLLLKQYGYHQTITQDTIQQGPKISRYEFS